VVGKGTDDDSSDAICGVLLDIMSLIGKVLTWAVHESAPTSGVCPIRNMLAVIREDLAVIRFRPVVQEKLAVASTCGDARIDAALTASGPRSGSQSATI
jgi:hypothetical protein